MKKPPKKSNAKSTYRKEDVFTLPDNGEDGKGGRKQAWYTFEHGMQLMVCGDSRLWYSPWQVPKHMLPESVAKRIKREPLGSAHKIAYGSALAAHLKIREDIRNDKYPDAASKKGPGRRPKGETFERYGTRAVTDWAAQRKNKKDAEGMKRIIPNYCSAINKLPIGSIGTTDVRGVIEPIWNKKPAMALEVRAMIARVLKAWAAENGTPHAINPADIELIRARLGNPKKKPGFIRGPMKAVPPEEIPEFMVELRATEVQTPRALELLILTNVRTNAMRWMRRSQLVLTDAEMAKRKSMFHDGQRWIVPPELMKVDDDNHPFVLPLVPRAVEIINQQIAYLEDLYDGKHEVDLLWPGIDRDTGKLSPDKPISENTMRDWLVDTMKRNATPHGFRASFQTWAENEVQEDGETAKFNPDAIGYSMAHNPGDKVKRAYRRNRLWKPRVGIMNAWARYLAPPKAKLRAVA
jgi:integrase